MIVDRYYYNHLNSVEKELYAEIYKGVVNLADQIRLPFMSIEPDAMHRVFHAITHDNPHLYYFNQSKIEFGMTPVGAICMPQYLVKKENIQAYNGRIEKKVTEIVEELTLNNCDALEKVRRLHDYFARNVSYDHEALNTNKINRLIASHSIIGVFSKQKAVCEGIAKAFKLILNTLDIPCIVVSGDATRDGQRFGHSWNIVKVNGQAYHLDMTWDLANSCHDEVNYDYFNLPDEAIVKDHFDYGTVPKCDSWKDNYFYSNNLIYNSYDELKADLVKKLDSGNYVFRFRMSNNCNMEDILTSSRDFILSEASKRSIRAKIVGNFNDSQNIGFIKMLLL